MKRSIITRAFLCTMVATGVLVVRKCDIEDEDEDENNSVT